MLSNLKYKLPENFNAQQLITAMSDRYSIKKEPAIAEQIAICDTFDWRLFNKSLVLYASGRRLSLRCLAESDVMQSAEISTLPVLIGEFPDGELKNRVAPIIKMRALLKLAEVHCRSRSYRVLNAQEKTVARLTYEEFRASRRKSARIVATFLWLKPVKGYPRHARNLAEQIEAAGLAVAKEDDIFFIALAAVDKKPGSYSAKINLQLDPAMRSDQAAKVIFRHLLDVMRINAANIEKDLDTEFLHDFRVAVRRTRSALAQIKAVFPTKTTDRFKREFAYIGKLSNELRDLDVYLLKEETYKDMLPAVLREDIDPLFDYLRRKRSKAWQKVMRGLKARKYAKIMQDWEAFLNQPQTDPGAASDAKLPVMELARNRIYKRYRVAVKFGSQILENTEDEKLHVLRIHCKKLRYLMEFFSSLFPRKKINRLIETLKKLQENLGDFNDLQVQKEYLLSIVAQLPASQHGFKKTHAAIGSLIGALDNEKQAVKDAFAKTFTEFASPANRELFRKLFVPKGQEEV